MFTCWVPWSNWCSSTESGSAEFDVHSEHDTHTVTLTRGTMPSVEELDNIIRHCAKRNPYFSVSPNAAPHVVKADATTLVIRYQ
jgi:hypothetical protein